MKQALVTTVFLLTVAVVPGMMPVRALTAEQEAKLLAADGGPSDALGYSASLDGDTLLIGALQDGDNGPDSGSAYVFTRAAGEWTEQAKLLASDGAAGDGFGGSVALDGDTALIGALFDDDNGHQSGSAYVFTRSAGVWSEKAKLMPADGGFGDNFGMSVTLDGDTAVIGAWMNNDNGPDSGSAYVFTRMANGWTEQDKLLPADGASNDWFGGSVALDSDTAVIGATRDDDNGLDSGSAYVFTRAGGVWTEQAKLLASDGQAGDGFGRVALDGNTAVVGARQFLNNGSGSAWVFTRTGDVWTEQARLLASDGEAGDRFGGVALDGDTVVISAKFDNDNSGSAYVFTRAGGVWTERAKLLPADGSAGDEFGSSVAMDGNTVLIGAWKDDDHGPDSGSAYVFRLFTDDPVPATGVVGGLLLLTAVAGTGVYFLRRRAADRGQV